MDVNIKGQVSIDTSAAEGSMTKLNATIKDAKKALADTKIGSNEYKAAHSNWLQHRKNYRPLRNLQTKPTEKAAKRLRY